MFPSLIPGQDVSLSGRSPLQMAAVVLAAPSPDPTAELNLERARDSGSFLLGSFNPKTLLEEQRPNC